MGLFPRRLATTGIGAADDYWYTPRGEVSASGVRVGTEDALGLPGFYGAVSMIAETVATVPFHMFERVQMFGHDAKRPATQHPLDDILNAQPNAYQTAAEFWEMLVAFAILTKKGIGIAERIAGPRGAVDQLVPLHPDLITERAQGGQPVFAYRDPKKNGIERILRLDEVFLLRGRLGKGLSEFARQNIGTSLAMQRYQGALFARGARNVSVLAHPGKLSPDTRAVIQKEIDKFTATGQYSGRPMLIEDGMTWQTAGMTGEDSQFVDLSKVSVLDAARYLRIPPHKLAALERMTYSSIEQLGIEFVTDTIRPWCVRIEQAVRRDLILNPARFFAEFNLEGLLRGDTQTRFAAYEIAIRNRWMTRNEVRAKENMEPVLGGDAFDEFATTGGTTPDAQPPRQIPDNSNNAAVAGYLRLMVRDAAARAVRKETAAITKLGDRRTATWATGVDEFYAEHSDFVAKLLRLEPETASEYAGAQRSRLVAVGHLDEEIDRIDDLTALAQAKVADVQVGDAPAPPDALNVTPPDTAAEMRALVDRLTQLVA